MARRTFFSFHFDRDAWRVGQVRNCRLIGYDEEDVGFLDAAEWQEVETQGTAAVYNWIEEQLEGTSVTVLLIGAETSERQYVLYELEASHNRGNGIVGVHIHNINDRHRQTDFKGRNPLDLLTFTYNGRIFSYSSVYNTYDWVLDSGYENIDSWIEAAAEAAGH